ncbi:MAG: DMT family transporter [Planctomycetes bacterium]|nr:DMT family transporter [Planctomycetota bacterium]
MWLILTLLSACFLGFYDVLKKVATRDNAVLPTLWLTTIAGFMLMASLMLGSLIFPSFMTRHGIAFQALSLQFHGLIFIKSLIVASSWILSFFAIKHLPLSIVGPIRATSPLWTLLGALLLYSERPNTLQWLGLIIAFASYYSFALLSRKEGFSIRNNIWLWAVIAATLISACSGLYDKCLLQSYALPPLTLQAWFSFYMVLILGLAVALFWWPKRKKNTPFKWRWSSLGVGILLILADFVYFRAVADPEALISVISALRRCSVLISFSMGFILYKEKNLGPKSLALVGVLLGVFLILLS